MRLPLGKLARLCEVAGVLRVEKVLASEYHLFITWIVRYCYLRPATVRMLLMDSTATLADFSRASFCTALSDMVYFICMIMPRIMGGRKTMVTSPSRHSYTTESTVDSTRMDTPDITWPSFPPVAECTAWTIASLGHRAIL